MIVRELKEKEYDEFKNGIQEAFQFGYEEHFGKCEDIIIPDKDILESYTTVGARSYVVEEDDKILGGCVVVINDETKINSLHILYVKPSAQSKGIGFFLWNEIENIYGDTVKWETCTPCFDKRNYHFYVDKCGFKVTRVFDVNEEDFVGDAGEGMYEFEKVMK